MENIVAIQRWLYSGMASGLGNVAHGDTQAILVAMAAALLFGAVHALMPGHGKTVLVSYHLGQPAKLGEGILNGAILALTHVALALILVLAGFAVISKSLAYGGAHRNSRRQAAFSSRLSAFSCSGARCEVTTTCTAKTARHSLWSPE